MKVLSLLYRLIAKNRALSLLPQKNAMKWPFHAKFSVLASQAATTHNMGFPSKAIFRTGLHSLR